MSVIDGDIFGEYMALYTGLPGVPGPIIPGITVCVGYQRLDYSWQRSAPRDNVFRERVLPTLPTPRSTAQCPWNSSGWPLVFLHIYGKRLTDVRAAFRYYFKRPLCHPKDDSTQFYQAVNSVSQLHSFTSHFSFCNCTTAYTHYGMN